MSNENMGKNIQSINGHISLLFIVFSILLYKEEGEPKKLIEKVHNINNDILSNKE